ncbi:hypothetical protein ACIPLR_15830 [Herbaspirillum huttiense]|uniref:Uncharacterized protein n=2 Tax=Herbaspirillum huttiense TaxID=863372 RepID=A0AAJ2LPP4_9BURK|nr:hypothetical protein [Herbaspirillum huttiense]MDR9834902.1 hypothetical protein [Herbaspirillum huttiense]
MNKELSPLAQRLEFLAAGRALHGWAKSIGLPKISIENVMKGNGLSYESLAHLHRVENVRTDWLLEGRGSPFSVNACLCDESADELLDELLAERWEVDVITDESRVAIVLSQPAQVQVKDGKDSAGHQKYRDINYRLVEIVCGALGPKAIARATSFGIHRVLQIGSDMMRELERGKLGSYFLFSSPTAVIPNAVQYAQAGMLFENLAAGEQAASTPDEKALLGSYRNMSSEKRRAISQVVISMADVAQRLR